MKKSTGFSRYRLSYLQVFYIAIFLFVTLFIYQFNRIYQKNDVYEVHTTVKSSSTEVSAAPRPNNYCASSSNIANQPYFFTPFFQGRLGNQFFIYASSYGISRCVGRIALFNKEWKEFFRIFESYPEDKFIMHTDSIDIKQYRRLTEMNLNCAFNGEIINDVVSTNGNVYVTGYLQSYKYFDMFRAELSQLRRFEPALRRAAERNLFNALRNYRAATDLQKSRAKPETVEQSTKDVIFVGVHVRRGDIADTKVYIDFRYQLATAEYLERAVNYFTSRFDPSRLVFVVATDNVAWTVENFPKNPDVHVHFLYKDGSTQNNNGVSTSNLTLTSKETNSTISVTDFLTGVSLNDTAVVDFVTLSLCNHTIQTVGSYGWWSAFLSGGISTYYARPFRAGTRLAAHFNDRITDYYLPEWIPMT